MQNQSDLQLLRDFARNGADAAFRELVARYTDLVYSAALRQVESSAAASDIAQGVFTDLARKARQVAEQMPDGNSLAGWLHRATRYAALNHLRDARRRLTNERQAMEQLLTNSESTADWEQIRPALDEALDSLGDEDREALLLRYFKNQDFRAVGQALGVSDDTAQKRVSRAVERIREYFSKRKISIGAGGLAALISANAVQSAPAGLAAAISAAVFVTGTAVTTSTTAIAVTKTIVMTTLQKTLITVTVAALAGGGIYEARQAAEMRRQNQTLQQQQGPLAEQIQQLQRERDAATNRLAGLLAENARLKLNPNGYELLKLRGQLSQLKTAANDPANVAEKEWLTKVNRLKQRLEATPGAKIPELQFLTDQDWLNAASGKLDTEMDFRRALASLRNAAENKFGSMVETALQKFSQANNQQFPNDLAQLQAYFDSPVDDSILQRWQVTSADTAPNLGLGNPIITEKAAVDELFDQRIAIGPRGYGSSDFLSSEIKSTLTPVSQAFQAANNGQEPANPSDLLPYATTDAQKSLLQKVILRASVSN